MAFRYFPDKSEAELLALRSQLTDQVIAGGAVRVAGAGDVSVELTGVVAPQTTLRKVNYDLCVIDPVTYPAEDLILPTRTKIRFTA